MTVHSFRESLARSNTYTDADWWPEVYREAFPTMQAMVCVRNDGWAQRGGIDRVLTLECGRTVTVDEKVREKDYGDILLEYWSNKERRVHGWVCKPLACDFIAYAVAPTKTCYLLPVLTLRRAWRLCGPEWVKTHKVCEARNEGYTTVSVAVPVGAVMDALKDASIVTWGRND